MLAALGATDDCAIAYTSADGRIVMPENLENIDAALVSNTCLAGQGLMVFDRPVTKVGPWAFSHCARLTSVVLPRSLRSLGTFAFEACTGLTAIHLPDSIEELGENPFTWCDALAEGTQYISCGSPRWTFNIYGNHQTKPGSELQDAPDGYRPYLLNSSGGFSHVSSSATLKPGRFYVERRKSANGYWTRTAPYDDDAIYLMVDGILYGAEATGIVAPASLQEESETFNLQGIKVDSDYKGMVVKNGKKILQK